MDGKYDSTGELRGQVQTIKAETPFFVIRPAQQLAQAECVLVYLGHGFSGSMCLGRG